MIHICSKQNTKKEKKRQNYYYYDCHSLWKFVPTRKQKTWLIINLTICFLVISVLTRIFYSTRINNFLLWSRFFFHSFIWFHFFGWSIVFNLKESNQKKKSRSFHLCVCGTCYYYYFQMNWVNDFFFISFNSETKTKPKKTIRSGQSSFYFLFIYMLQQETKKFES